MSSPTWLFSIECIVASPPTDDDDAADDDDRRRRRRRLLAAMESLFIKISMCIRPIHLWPHTNVSLPAQFSPAQLSPAKGGLASCCTATEERYILENLSLYLLGLLAVWLSCPTIHRRVQKNTIRSFIPQCTHNNNNNNVVDDETTRSEIQIPGLECV